MTPKLTLSAAKRHATALLYRAMDKYGMFSAPALLFDEVDKLYGHELSDWRSL